MNDYRPIGCGLHSEYELLAMRRQFVLITHVDRQGRQEQLEGRAMDVATRDGAEYLLLENPPGEPHWIRLDRIIKITT